ncbi:unnamed protein product [Pseudo-nitzschia multistriata]|uniref:Uncharacterized protein n=1 Tax=Pseudo-nitzschia multistriata TaxID=183589 RepID=A0A448ZFT2_9STRA|nr:unnamed protein product [Pseudo-nitzschia multistriata]
MLCTALHCICSVLMPFDSICDATRRDAFHFYELRCIGWIGHANNAAWWDAIRPSQQSLALPTSKPRARCLFLSLVPRARFETNSAIGTVTEESRGALFLFGAAAAAAAAASRRSFASPEAIATPVAHGRARSFRDGKHSGNQTRIPLSGRFVGKPMASHRMMSEGTAALDHTTMRIVREGAMASNRTNKPKGNPSSL